MEQVFLCLLPLLPIALKFSTLLYFISLSGYRNIAQGGDPANGDVDWKLFHILVINILHGLDQLHLAHCCAILLCFLVGATN